MRASAPLTGLRRRRSGAGAGGPVGAPRGDALSGRVEARMIKASIPIMVEDPLVAAEFHFKPDNVFTDEERFFLDGPVSARVAVFDREPTSGQLAPLVPVAPNTKPLRYARQPDGRLGTMALSASGPVPETIQMFERPDVLGPRLAWAFGSPQLLVVPRAGIWK